jgi:hypothetical protein
VRRLTRGCSGYLGSGFEVRGFGGWGVPRRKQMLIGIYVVEELSFFHNEVMKPMIVQNKCLLYAFFSDAAAKVSILTVMFNNTFAITPLPIWQLRSINTPQNVLQLKHHTTANVRPSECSPKRIQFTAFWCDTCSLNNPGVECRNALYTGGARKMQQGI